MIVFVLGCVWIYDTVLTFFLGGPGAGKGTQCSRVVSEIGFIHISAGELLRDEIKSESKDGEIINNIIKAGKIVPSEITVGLLEKAINKFGWEKRYVIDGFPRNQENVDVWNKQVY